METVNFAPNAVIFKEGDKPDGVYLVISGNVEISRMEAGAKVPLAHIGADKVFGEMALIDNNPRSATAIALAPTQCMKGSPENFAALMNKVDPAVKNALMQISNVIREKNKMKKTQLNQNDVAVINSLKQKSEQLKHQIMTNQPLLDKIRKLDPFINGVFNGLLQLALK